MLCFLLQIDASADMSCQFQSQQTVATVNASNVGNMKTGLQHTGHTAPTGLWRTHKPDRVCAVYGRQIDTRPNRGGEMLAQAMQGL